MLWLSLGLRNCCLEFSGPEFGLQRLGFLQFQVEGPTQRVHVAVWYILGPYSRYMGTPLGLNCIPYTYMDPLGKD